MGLSESVDNHHDDNEGEGVGSSNWLDLVPLETRQSPYLAAMATTAFAVFLVLSSSLIFIAGRRWGAPKTIILSMKKSSIDGN